MMFILELNFGFDRLGQLPINTGPIPSFEEHVLEKNERLRCSWTVKESFREVYRKLSFKPLHVCI